MADTAAWGRPRWADDWATLPPAWVQRLKRYAPLGVQGSHHFDVLENGKGIVQRGRCPRWLVYLLMNLHGRAHRFEKIDVAIGKPLACTARELRCIVKHRRALSAAFRLGEEDGLMEVWERILHG